MEVKEIKESEFENIIKEGNTIIDCYATWCGPCKMMAPIVDEIAKNTADWNFYKLDVDQAENTAMNYGIMSIPTLLFFKEGNLIHKEIGLRSKEELDDIIKKL